MSLPLPLPTSLDDLRRRLAEVVEGARPRTPAVPTGVAALDALLPGGGLPRGRLTELLGRPGSGRTTLLRQMVETAVLARTWVAVVDATRTLAAADWAPLGHREELWMVRPREPGRGAWCADVLLRSGAFGLVVLDGAPALSRAVAMRLVHLARDTDAAFVVLAADGAPALTGSALRLEVGGSRPSALGARRDRRGREPSAESRERSSSHFHVTVAKGGIHPQPVEVSCAIGVARRLCAHPEVPDRRGVGKRGGGAAGAGGPAALAAPGGPRLRGHARRCAESDFGRVPAGGERAAALGPARARAE